MHLLDGNGLFLLVNRIGGKRWRFNYRFAGKTNSLGTYPEIIIKVARDRREDARRLGANGTDPSVERKEQKGSELAPSTTFEHVFHARPNNQKPAPAKTGSDKINAGSYWQMTLLNALE